MGPTAELNINPVGIGVSILAVYAGKRAFGGWGGALLGLAIQRVVLPVGPSWSR